jgi:hypothetical protein
MIVCEFTDSIVLSFYTGVSIVALVAIYGLCLAIIRREPEDMTLSTPEALPNVTGMKGGRGG